MINLIIYPIVYILLIMMRISNFFHVSIFISKIPFSFGNIIRFCFYKKTLNRVGKNVFFPYGIIFSHKNISIGDNVRFGPYNTIGLVDFGNNIIIAQYVHFLSGNRQHGYSRRDLPMMLQEGKIIKLKINDDVWIGTNSVIMKDVNEGSIVAAGSIVTKTYDKYTIIGGNPAKIIGKR